MSRRRGWWYHTRDVVRSYPVLRDRLRELQRPSLSPGRDGLPGGSEPGRTTEQLALRMLPPVEQEDLDAVERAVTVTRGLPDGKERLRIVRLVHWRMSHTISGAAMAVHVSVRTAYRWQNDFFLLVARFRGFIDNDQVGSPGH